MKLFSSFREDFVAFCCEAAKLNNKGDALFRVLTNILFTSRSKPQPVLLQSSLMNCVSLKSLF